MAQMTSVGCISTTSGVEIISADDVGIENTWQYAAFAVVSVEKSRKARS